MFAAILTTICLLGSFAAKGEPKCLCELRRLLDVVESEKKDGNCTRTVSIRPSFVRVTQGAFFNMTRTQTVHLTARLTLEGLDCPTTTNNRYSWHWTVYSEYESETSVFDTEEGGGPYMKIDGASYWSGAYKVNVTLAVQGEQVPQASGPSSQLRFMVLSTPLAVRIAGGDFRTVPWGTVPEFDASLTYDPDGDIPAKTIRFRWFCRSSRDVGTKECLDFSVPLNRTGPKLRLPAYKNKLDTNLIVKVVAYGDANLERKTGQHEQMVLVRREASPEALIECIYNCGNPKTTVNDKMVLRVSCPHCYEDPIWSWDIASGIMTLYDNGTVGSIAPGAMQPSKTYKHCVYAKYARRPESTAYLAKACLKVRTSERAPVVTCTVSPKKGVSVLTPFRVKCEGGPPDEPLLYQAYQVLDDRGRPKGTLLRHGFEAEMDNLLLLCDGNEEHQETIVVNVTDADYARVATVWLRVTVTRFDEEECEKDLEDCVRSLGLPSAAGNGSLSLLEELATRGRLQESLNVGQGLVCVMARMGGNKKLLEKLQVALLQMILKMPLWSVAAIEQMAGALENVLRATWPYPPSERVASLAMDVAFRAGEAIENIAADRQRPIYGQVVRVSQLLMESLRGVFNKGLTPEPKGYVELTVNSTEERRSLPEEDAPFEPPPIEDRLRDVTDSLAWSVSQHKFPGEAATEIVSTNVYLTVATGPYSQLVREIRAVPPLKGFGSSISDDVRKGFVRFGPDEGLGDAMVTVHLVEYLRRPVFVNDDVTTHVMDLRVKKDGERSFRSALGPVDYFLYVQDTAVPPWLGPFPLRVKMPQDYAPEDVSARKGTPGRPFFDVAVLSRTDDPFTALEVRVEAGLTPGLGSFSPHETKPAPPTNDDAPFDEPAQYVTYVPWEVLVGRGTQLHVGVLPFRNVSFRSFYHFETTTYKLSMLALKCRDLNYAKGNCSVLQSAFTNLWSLACRCYSGATRVGAVVRAVSLEEERPPARLFLLIASNPSTLAAIGGVILAYLVALAVAWVIDRNLRHQCGVTFAKDSDPGASRHYLAVVYTGYPWNAGTSSRVAVRFEGRASRSQVHLVADGRTKRFARGGEDRFLFATERALGPVKSVHVWVDLAGPNPTWFLHKIVLVDVALEESWLFVANKWFGKRTEEDPDTLLTWARVPLTTERDKFKSLLVWRILKGLQNDHLWLSVLFRWPASCFKCVHRATALLITVLFAAFVNLALKGLPAEDAAFEAAPRREKAALEESDLCSAFLCTCVVVAVQVPFVQLLRRLWRCDKWQAEVDMDDRWPLLIPPPSPVPAATPPLHQGTQGNHHHHRVEFVTVVVAEGNARTGYDLKLQHPPHPAEQEEAPPSKIPPRKKVPAESAEDARERKEKKASDAALRHWVRGFAWVALAALTLSLVGANVVYGLRMTPAETRVWVTSTALTLALSVFVFEPLTVVAIAAIGASRGQEKLIPPVDWCAESVAQRDEAIEDSGGTHEEYARYLTRLRAEEPMYLPRRGPKVRRPRNAERRERVMMGLVADIFSFVAFVVFLWVLMLETREDLSFYSTSTIDRLAVSGAFATTKGLGAAQVRDAKDFYRYLSENLVPALQPQDGESYWTAAGSTLLLGAVRIRQIRSSKVTCPVRSAPSLRFYTTRDAELADGDCLPQLSAAVEEKGDFGAGWSVFVAGAEDAWTYNNASEAPGMSVSGRVTSVPLGGYVTSLGPTRAESLKVVSYLKSKNWVDRSTRAVVLELSTLSPFVNVLTVCQLVVEFPPTGGAVASWFVDSFRPIRYLGYSRPGVLLCYGFVVAFCVALAWREAAKFVRSGRFYFSDAWNLVNLSIVALSCAYLACVFLSYGIDVQHALRGEEKYYLDPSGPLRNNRWATGTLALLLTASMAKLWKLLSFNRHMYGFVLTLRYCASPLAAILVPFLLIYVAFASYVHVLFGDSDRDARTFGSSMAQMFFATIASVRFQVRKDRGPSAARFARMAFFGLFLFIVFVYMVTMFVSIILRSFKKAAARKDLMRNRYEVLNFVSAKAFAAVGKGRPAAYRQCLDAVRESHLAELTVGCERAERLGHKALVQVRRVARIGRRRRRRRLI